MIKTFIKHQIYEKCIDIIFDGIWKSFVKPKLDFEVLHFREKMGDDGYLKMNLAYMHKGRRNDIVLSVPARMKKEMAEIHGKSDSEIDNLFMSMAMEEMERNAKMQEVGAKRYFEEEFGIKLPEDVEEDYYESNEYEVDVDDAVNDILNN